MKVCFSKSIFLVITSFICATSFAKGINQEKSFSCKTLWHGSIQKDSIVLVLDSDSEFSNNIKIFRDNKLLFEINDSSLQIKIDGQYFREFEIKPYEAYFYIFELHNAPQPSKFLILLSTKREVTLFGITKPSTAEIFGDIDYDGKFEIGGFEDYCEAGDRQCNRKSYYSVFELDKDFPFDKKLTTYFKAFLK